MSKYTTELRFICESITGRKESAGLDEIESIISKAAPILFNFSFPIFDETYRLSLEIKIIRHFYTREIGFETAGLWRLKLNTKMNEIMPYYNQLYESARLRIDPFLTKNMDKTSDKKNDSQTGGTNKGTNNSTNRNLYSDTPQGGLQGVEDEEYLTNARKIIEDSEHQNDYSSLNISNEGYSENIKGFDLRSQSALLKEYRETFLNIDMQIIEELEELFMGVW